MLLKLLIFLLLDFPSTYTESVNCSWGSWKEWSSCSSICGTGKQIRRRGKDQVASHGGRPCSGESFEEANCNIIPCDSGKTKIDSSIIQFSSSETSAFGCLVNLGYINTFLPTDSANAKQDFHSHLRKFQELVGLEVTGEVDNDTRDVMALTRCGIGIDEEPVVSNNNKTPYWNYRILTYRILKYSSKLNKTEVDLTIRQAMDLWEGSADIKFILTPGNPDIEILFTTGDHGDGVPFDGEDGSRAHGFYPSKDVIGGDLHFNDDVPWSVTPYIGRQLLQSAAHELGHILSLGHSRVRESVMYFAFPGWNPNLELHQDDIDRVQ